MSRLENQHGKHPLPWDFFYSFNNSAGKSLDWFWTNWYFTNNYIDFAVGQVTEAANGYTVTIKNIGGYPAPVDIAVKYADGSTEIFHQTPALWSSKQQEAAVSLPVTKKIKSLRLNGGIFVDAKPSNNSWTSP